MPKQRKGLRQRTNDNEKDGTVGNPDEDEANQPTLEMPNVGAGSITSLIYSDYSHRHAKFQTGKKFNFFGDAGVEQQWACALQKGRCSSSS